MPVPIKLHGNFHRQDIATAVGYSKRITGGFWNNGVVPWTGRIFLFVTLEKKGFRKEHRYVDRFEGPRLFSWAAQPNDSSQSRSGRRYINHEDALVSVYLFVRPTRLESGKKRAFTYFGRVTAIQHQGPKPLRVLWLLETPVPSNLRGEFQVHEV
jgi:hypothetical protein